MAWQRVGSEDHQRLSRVVEILQACHPSVFFEPFDREAAFLQHEMSWGRLELYYLPGSSFELVNCFRYRPRRDRHYVCPNFVGDIEPQRVLDLVIDQATDYLTSHGLRRLYGLEPLQPDSAGLREFYTRVRIDPRLRSTVIQRMPDLLSFAIELAPTAMVEADDGRRYLHEKRIHEGIEASADQLNNTLCHTD